MCQLAIKVERAEEVRRAVAWHTNKWGPDTAAMLSATVRHGIGHDLRTVRRGVSNAFRKLTSGAPFKRKTEQYGLVGRIRAMEITHGITNGWHPHLHIVILSEIPLDPEFTDWVRHRWCSIIERELGPEHIPTMERGVIVTPCHRADYLQKLGLEISAPSTKSGRHGNRTPLQLLADAVCDGDAEALDLYAHYCAAMKGARMLTWSKGLKSAAGVDEKSDEEIVEGEAAAEEHVLTLKGDAWDALRDVPGAPHHLLELAETSREAAKLWVLRAFLWPPGYDPLTTPDDPNNPEEGP